MRRGKASIVSWSGGKDSMMALAAARDAGHDVRGLFTMFSPTSGTSRSHGLPRGFLADQAAAMGLPLHTAAAGWSDYEQVFKRALTELVEQGIEVAIFGDIFLDDHRQWVERVCAECGCEAVEPLWEQSTAELARAAVAAGIDARICTVRSDKLSAASLGARLTTELIEAFEKAGIDPCGEYGEYHTAVVGSPAYDRQIVVDAAQLRRADDHAHWHIEKWHTTHTPRLAVPATKRLP